MKFIRKVLIAFAAMIVLYFLQSCSQNFPLDKDLTLKSYKLLNQDSVDVLFPSIIKNKITVMGFIYTHCPDICPMTTHNIQLVQDELDKEGIENINYVLLSFDPGRDKPEVLKKFAELRDIDFNKWSLLTGENDVVSDLIRRFEVTVIFTDSTYSDDGELAYSVMHTDRIALIDQDSKLRNYYKGSTANISELINDVKRLGD